MEWYTMGGILLGVLLMLLFLGTPIVFCIGLTAVAAMWFMLGPKFISAMGEIAFTTSTHFVLISVPLFLLMAEIIMFSGLGEISFSVVNKWLGNLPGGLALSATAACAIFAACTGSSVANTATIGAASIPEMMKVGYDKKLATGCIAAGGALGILIPPSILMVVYGVLTEQSVGHLFMGGVFPGLLLAGLFMTHIAVRCTLNPTLAPKIPPTTWKDRVLSLYRMLPVLILIFLVLATIYSGIATPTEAAGAGAMGAFIIAAVYRKLSLRKLIDASFKAAQTSCFIFFIMIACNILVFVLSALEIPQEFAGWVVAQGKSRWAVIIAINVLYLLLGCLLDPSSILILTVPVLVPVVTALGFDLVWFGVIATMNMEMANITPPVGFNLFVLKGISPPEVTANDIMLGATPFVIYQALGIALCMVFPQVIMWLPNTMTNT